LVQIINLHENVDGSCGGGKGFDTFATGSTCSVYAGHLHSPVWCSTHAPQSAMYLEFHFLKGRWEKEAGKTLVKTFLIQGVIHKMWLHKLHFMKGM
jgi:hypothetical protein